MGPFDKKPIMLAEDNSDDEMLTLRALKQNNIANEVVVARDGVEVLDFLFCQGPHSGRNPAEMPAMLLLDLKMPRMGGLEVLGHLRTDPRTELLPIIILTARGEEGDAGIVVDVQEGEAGQVLDAAVGDIDVIGDVVPLVHHRGRHPLEHGDARRPGRRHDDTRPGRNPFQQYRSEPRQHNRRRNRLVYICRNVK